MYFFSVLLWLLSDILFENTNITRASVPSDHLSLRKVNAIYIYVHMEKCLRIYPYDIFYSNLYPTTLEKNNIFFSRTRIFSFSFKKKERKKNDSNYFSYRLNPRFVKRLINFSQISTRRDDV